MMQKIALVAAALVLAIASFSIGGELAERRNSPVPSSDATPLAARVGSALAEPDAIVRTRALTTALKELNGKNVDEVVAIYEDLFELAPPRATSVELLGDAWAAFDPEGAIERMSSWPGELRRSGIFGVSRAWARRAPEQAFTWAESLSLDDRAAAMDAVFQGWAESGDSEIWGFLGSLTPGLERESATNIVMKVIVQESGFDELFEQVDAISTKFAPGSPDDFKLSALRTAVGLCAYYDPDRALAFARRYADGPYDNGLLRRVAIYWAVKDGARAMDAFVELPTGPQRDKALRDGYMKWLRTAGPAALAWVPKEAAYDERYAPLVELYVIAFAKRKSVDPLVAIEESVSFIDTIKDAHRRRNLSILLGVHWLNHDPESARAWIDARGIAKDVEIERTRRVTTGEVGEAAVAGRPARRVPTPR